MPKFLDVSYFNVRIAIEFSGDKNEWPIGKVLLTQAGRELALICGAEPSDEYFLYVINVWYRKGYILSSILPCVEKNLG